MPTPQQIVAGLTAIANDALALAVAWHVVVAVAIAGLMWGWRPSRSVAGVLLAVPAASVAVLAFRYHNPFNGILFAALSVSLAGIGASLGHDRARMAPPWSMAFGIAMLLFGWAYPHFLVGHPPWVYLYAAPLGLVPCPTLSVMVGFALIGGGFGSRTWSLVLAGSGMFYGVFGVVRLGVTIDVVLVVGASCLALLTLLPTVSRSYRLRYNPGGDDETRTVA